MLLFTWIAVGVLAGSLSSLIIRRGDKGWVLNICIGAAGAVIGGRHFMSTGIEGVSPFGVYGIAVAVIGAVVLLAAYHALVRRTRQ